MYIKTFALENFRNIASLTIDFGEGINVIQGDNGAGKSSILEGLYYLSRGRSFRANTPTHLLQYDAPSFVLHASVCEEMDVSLGIERSRNGTVRLRKNGQKVASLSDVSAHVPTLFLDTDSHRTLASGPKARRSLVDWGLFYQNKDSFLSVWQGYQRVLAQRNSALKTGYIDSGFWDDALVELGEKLTAMRQAYLEDLQPHVNDMWMACSGQEGPLPVLHYQKGWPAELSLQEAFARNGDRDRQYGLTHAGPHRGDLKIQIGDKAAIHYLSQGQQKTLTYALALAQGQLLHASSMRKCVYLLDDVCSELDAGHRSNILKAIKKIDSQIIATVIEEDGLWRQDHCQIFHLKTQESLCVLA